VELINKWRIEDKQFYDKTGGFTAVLDMVKSKNYLTIIGGPGSGKTATAADNMIVNIHINSKNT
jgi:ABC-type dipeptide/oligopeptide/nickel transport system ATPase component